MEWRQDLAAAAAAAFAAAVAAKQELCLPTVNLDSLGFVFFYTEHDVAAVVSYGMDGIMVGGCLSQAADIGLMHLGWL